MNLRVVRYSDLMTLSRPTEELFGLVRMVTSFRYPRGKRISSLQLHDHMFQGVLFPSSLFISFSSSHPFPLSLSPTFASSASVGMKRVCEFTLRSPLAAATPDTSSVRVSAGTRTSQWRSFASSKGRFRLWHPHAIAGAVYGCPGYVPAAHKCISVFQKSRKEFALSAYACTQYI